METKLALPAQSKFSEEVAEWIEAFDDLVVGEGPVQGAELIAALRQRAREAGISTPSALTTPYLNTIPKHDEVPYPGDRKLEERLESPDPLERDGHGAWPEQEGCRHWRPSSPPTPRWPLCSKWASTTSSTLPMETSPGDFIYFQGHASPGVYARAYLEGRFDDDRLLHFRHELRDKPGLSSYPHPWLMPDFWRFPTVSMGIGPAQCDLPGALHALPGEPQPDSRNRPQNLGIRRRRRD